MAEVEIAQHLGLGTVSVASVEKNSYLKAGMYKGLKNNEELFDFVDIHLCPPNVLIFHSPHPSLVFVFVLVVSCVHYVHYCSMKNLLSVKLSSFFQV